MKLDNSTVEQARNSDIIAFFEKYCGYTFATHGGVYRCKQHPSLAVKSDRRSWFWHSQNVGGFGPLDYLVKIENMPFRDAVAVVDPLSVTSGPSPSSPKPQAVAPQPPKTLILPEKAAMPLRLYKYLCNMRGLDSDIVNSLMQKGVLYEDRRGNVVFVGHDEQCKARFASLRGTHGDCSFRGDCAGSDKRYGFNMTACAPSERLYIFESAIDLISHASLEKALTGAWEQHHRLSLSGTSDTAIPLFLNKHPLINELVFCLDNDNAGREAAINMARKYTEKGLTTRLELPRGKDINEDLQAYKRHIQAEKRPKTRHHDASL